MSVPYVEVRSRELGGSVDIGLFHQHLSGGSHVRGPGVGASIEASNRDGVKLMARAQVLTLSQGEGEGRTRVGLAFDTGVGIGPEGLEAKVLGTGLRLGPRPSVSLVGNELECSVM
uniref:Uncharacterized protein n=1 Tax=Salmo trutta TaxID=8032 RepID=A0A674BC11_SALTR